MVPSKIARSVALHQVKMALGSNLLVLHLPVSLLKNCFKPGSSLSRAKAGNCTTDCNSPDNLSLFLCCFSNPTYLKHWRILYHTHTSRLPRLSSPGLGSLLNHLAEHSVVYWANWLPQYQNQKMLSSINWLRQLIARDMAKQHQLKNQLTKSHESSLPTIGRDSCHSKSLSLQSIRLSTTIYTPLIWEVSVRKHEDY